MKKFVLLAVAMSFSMASFSQNGMSAGIYGGIPVGDASTNDSHSFAIGVDLAYMWEVSTKFRAGLSVGYHNGFGKDFSTELLTINRSLAVDGKFVDYGVAIIGVRPEIDLSDKIELGLTVGYGVATGDGYNGGLAIQPSVGYNIKDNIQIRASYLNVNESDLDFNWSTINFGLDFHF